MKFAIFFALICAALLFGGCADQSLSTDEEYREYKKPAPYSPDPAVGRLPGYR